MKSRLFFSLALFVLGLFFIPTTIKNFFYINRELTFPTLFICYSLSSFFLISATFIFFLEKQLKIHKVIIEIRKLFTYFLLFSITPILFVSIESFLWLGNKFFGEPSEYQDMIAQNEMKKHAGENFKSNGIVFPSKHSSEFFSVNTSGFRTYSFKKKKDAPRIAMIGGSTTYGINVSDNNTISKILENIINNKIGNVSVWNLGVSGINSFDEYKVLESNTTAIKPDIIIFYHGANDFAQIYYELFNTKNQSLILEDNIKNRIYIALNQFHITSLLKIGSYLFKTKILGETKLNSPDFSIESFESQINKTSNFCTINNLKCFFFMQPILENKKDLTFFEKKILFERKYFFPEYGKLYDLFAQKVIANQSLNYFDLRHILDKDNNRHFYDYVHTTSNANKIIANKIFDYLITNNGFDNILDIR